MAYIKGRKELGPAGTVEMRHQADAANTSVKGYKSPANREGFLQKADSERKAKAAGKVRRGERLDDPGSGFVWEK